VRAETRHQLKTDAFSRVTLGAAEKTAHWSVEHRNTLVAAAIAVIVIAAVVGGGWYYQSTQNEKASFEFSEAVRTLDMPLRPPGTPPQPEVPTFASAKERAEAAHKQFQAIVDKYPHTHTADMARYFLGVTAASEGDDASAEKYFREVSGHGSKELASVANLALASLEGNTNRTKDAEALYQDLINHPTASVSKVTAQLELAELYKTSNRPLDAKRLYEQIKKENPGPEAVQIATEKLTELK
jgi:predicted negative regulator of RcsB-dependent stress response